MFKISVMKFKLKCTLKKFVVAMALFCILFKLFSVLKQQIQIPTQWKKQDIHHILKLLLDWQNFPLHQISVIPVNSSIPLTASLGIEIDMMLFGKNTNFYFYKIQNEKSNIGGHDSSKLVDTFLNFQPMMTEAEKKILLYSFHAFIEVCKKFNFTYFVIEGTLIGVYRHMGVIPWDDDVDVIMDAANWQQIRDVFSGLQEFELHTETMYQWKIYAKGLNCCDSSKPFKWPFIDIFFFSQDESHLWGITPALKPRFLYKKTDVFPLIARPFENLIINVPKNIEFMLSDAYDVTKCVTSDYLHKINIVVTSDIIRSVPCSLLYNLYPFVFRHIDSTTGHLIEKLMLGSVVVRENVYV